MWKMFSYQVFNVPSMQVSNISEELRRS